MINHIYIAPFPMSSENRVRLWDYNATMTDFSCECDHEALSWVSGSSLIVLGQEDGNHSIKMEVAYTWNPIMTMAESGTTACVNAYYTSKKARVRADMAQVEARMLGKFVVDIGDGYEYHCALSGNIGEKWSGDVQCIRTYEMNAVKCGHLITVEKNFTSTGWRFSVYNPGNAPRSDLRLYIGNSKTENRRIITVGELTYDTTYSTSDATIDLDGINKRLQLGEINLASKITWDDLPYLQPGTTIIKDYEYGTFEMSITVTATWYPCYL